MSLPGVDAGLLPPLRLPLRFFLTAPLFGAFCALWLLSRPDSVWITRWHPALLGAVHLLVLGFLVMVMVGALAQVIPVLACRPLAGARRGLPLVHGLLVVGTLLLAAGLGSSRSLLLPWAVIALLGGLGLMAGLLVRTLFRPPAGEAAVGITRLAVVALVITVLLGAWLALALRWPGSLPFSRVLTNLHAAWGLAGAAGLLILAVGSQVIPMFHVTPALPPRRLLLLGRGGFALLAAALVAWLAGADSWAILLSWLSLAGPLVFAARVPGWLAHRKRKVPDATVDAWRGSAWATLVGITVLVLAELLPPGRLPAGSALAAQVLLVMGGPLLVVVGMLMKIVPFLAWLHLQNRAGFVPQALGRVPHMQQLIPALHARWQVRIHLLATAGLALCPVVPVFHRPAALLLLGDMLLLFLLMGRAALHYRRAALSVDEALAEGGTGAIRA